MAALVDPTEGLLLRDMTELAGIIADQRGHHGNLQLRMIGREGRRLQDACLLLFVQAAHLVVDQRLQLPTHEPHPLRPASDQSLRPLRGLEEVQPSSRLVIEQELQFWAAL